MNVQILYKSSIIQLSGCVGITMLKASQAMIDYSLYLYLLKSPKILQGKT